jgi:hypothetical protein
MTWQQFVVQVGQLAQQVGISDVLVVVRDPSNPRQVGFYGPPGSLTRLKPDIAAKLGLSVDDVEWPA